MGCETVCWTLFACCWREFGVYTFCVYLLPLGFSFKGAFCSALDAASAWAGWEVAAFCAAAQGCLFEMKLVLRVGLAVRHGGVDQLRCRVAAQGYRFWGFEYFSGRLFFRA